ncbi:hypothetical protein [Nostoc sp. CALU 546]|uniref:hypothetical protein n=1 Tax=Nostoc sp. CALU 546 TaxID=1867241 RepID=UPI003B676183
MTVEEAMPAAGYAYALAEQLLERGCLTKIKSVETRFIASLALTEPYCLYSQYLSGFGEKGKG